VLQRLAVAVARGGGDMQRTCSRRGPRRLTHKFFFNLDDLIQIFREHTNLQWHFEDLQNYILLSYHTAIRGQKPHGMAFSYMSLENEAKCMVS
jgi:hypothetical protein